MIEATAFGTLRVIDTFARSGVKTKALVGCGGIAQKNPMLMQIYADVTGRPIQVAASDNASSLGAAILGAVAAGKAGGGYDDVRSAVRKMCRKPAGTYRPKTRNHDVYKKLYTEYKRLSDAFGRYRQPAMRVLRDVSGSVS